MKDEFQPLTDSEWEVIQKTLNDQRQRFYDLRQIWDAMLWLVWTGCQWRALTRAWQMPWQSIYYYFRKWKNNALFEQLKDELLFARRLQEDRKASPSAIAVDSQSVKVTSFVREDTGIDANKRLNGRKRHLAVDALGYPMALCVTGADVSDTAAGKTLADRVAAKLTDWSVRYQVPTRLALVRADAGYKTSFVEHVTQTYDWLVDIAQKPASVKGFVPQAGRWQVERSYGWLNFRRRLSRDYEKTVESSEAMLYVAFISFLLPKVAT